MASLTDELVRRFLARYPGARDADRTEPMYRWQIRMLRSVLAYVDMVLEDLNVDEDVRRQAMTAALYGSAPDPHEAQERLQERAEQLEKLRTTAAPARLHTEQDLAAWLRGAG